MEAVLGRRCWAAAMRWQQWRDDASLPVGFAMRVTLILVSEPRSISSNDREGAKRMLKCSDVSMVY